MNSELHNDDYFKALLTEALGLGIWSAKDCGHIKCLIEKIEAFYYELSISEQIKQIEQIEQFRVLLMKIKDYLIKQEIEEENFNRFYELIKNDKKDAISKLIEEHEQQEEVFTLNM